MCTYALFVMQDETSTIEDDDTPDEIEPIRPESVRTKPVRNEVELRAAVRNAVGSTIIPLDKDIPLTFIFIIDSDKDITLTSNSATGFYKLIGANHVSTIIVETNGVLRLDTVLLKGAF